MRRAPGMSQAKRDSAARQVPTYLPPYGAVMETQESFAAQWRDHGQGVRGTWEHHLGSGFLRGRLVIFSTTQTRLLFVTMVDRYCGDGVSGGVQGPVGLGTGSAASRGPAGRGQTCARTITRRTRASK